MNHLLHHFTSVCCVPAMDCVFVRGHGSKFQGRGGVSCVDVFQFSRSEFFDTIENDVTGSHTLIF